MDYDFTALHFAAGRGIWETMGKSGQVMLALVFLLIGCVSGLYVGPASLEAGQSKTTPEQSTSPPSQDSSLDFLGTYSAPSAVLATETGHTSAHPPSPTAAQRLHQIEFAVAVLPPWPEDLIWPARTLEASCGGTGKRDATVGLTPRQTGRHGPVPASAGNPRRDSHAYLILTAERYIRRRRFADARLQYAQLVRLDPDCKAAHWNLAVVEAYRNDPQASRDIGRWLTASPSPQNGELLSCLLNIRAGNPGLAKIPPASPSATLDSRIRPEQTASQRTLIWSRALAAQFQGDLPQARAGLLRLLPTNLRSSEVWYALGSVALDEARTTSRTLAEIAPRSDWNRKLESEALASRYPELAQEIWPGKSSASGTEPGTLIGVGGSRTTPKLAPAQALSQARAIAARLVPLESGAIRPQALYARARQSIQLAGLSFDQATRSPGFEAQMEALRALAAEQEDDDKQALAIYLEGLKQHPGSAALHSGLGELLRHRLELPQARAELERAWRLDPNDPMVAYELGDVYQRLDEPRRAIPHLNQALQLDPGLLFAQWSRAKAYLALGNLLQASRDFKAAAPIDPSGEVEWQLSRVYGRLGEAGLAHQAAQKAEALRRKQAVSQAADD